MNKTIARIMGVVMSQLVDENYGQNGKIGRGDELCGDLLTKIHDTVVGAGADVDGVFDHMKGGKFEATNSVRDEGVLKRGDN